MRALERGFSALWRRARETLGDVTLLAIADRVMVQARERYPFLADARLTAAGLTCGETLRRASVPPHTMHDAVRDLLVQFLVVLGNLTAEILSTPLHEELAQTPRPDTSDVSVKPAATKTKHRVSRKPRAERK